MPLFKVIKNFWQLTLREARIIAGEHSLTLTLLIAPLLYAFFYGSIYSYKEEENIRLAVVDDDHSSLSRLMTQQIGNAQVASVFLVPTIEDAKEAMYKGNAQGFVYIEKGLEEEAKSLKQAHVVVALNASRFLPAGDLLGSLNQICLTLGAGVRLQYLQKLSGMTTEISQREVMPVHLDYRPLFNDTSSYGAFILPGLLALILQQTLLFGLSGSVAGERKNKTVGEWLQKSSNNLSMALWGKGFFYLFLFSCYSFFFITVNYAVLGLPMRGNGFELGVVFILFFATLIPMGQFIGSFFKSPLLAIQMMAFSTYPFFLLSGYSFPLQNIPHVLQWISMLLPITHFLKIYQSIVQSGATIFQNENSFFALIGLFFLYTLLALWRIKKMKRIN